MQKLNRYLLLFNLFFLQSYLLRFSIFAYPSNLQEILLGFNLLILFFVLFQKGVLWKALKNVFKKYKILSFVWAMSFLSLFLMGIGVLDVLSSIDLLRHLKFLFFASIFVFIFMETFVSEEERLYGVKIVGFGALCFGVFSLLWNLTGHDVTFDYRLIGVMDAAVYLAYYLTPFFIFFAISAFEKKISWIFAFLLGILIVATKSMGAVGASFLVICLYVFLKHRKSILKFWWAKFLFIFLGLLISVFVFYMKILPTLQTEYSSLDERGEIWATSVELLKNPKTVFFGLGLSQFEANYIENVDRVIGHPPLDYNIIQPHNLFFLFIFHYGIFGIAFLIFLFWKILMGESNVWKFILLYFLIHGMIDTPFYKNDILILLFLFLELGFERGRVVEGS